jgi:RNA polymerase sigma-70 factor (ECF subfamily)
VEGRPTEDSELVESARQGDVGAYEELVKRYQHVALRVAFLITRDQGEAEDAAQEAFVKGYRALPRFKPGSPFRPWILTIVSNEAKNRRVSRSRRAALTLRAQQNRPSGGAAPSPEVAALEGEMRATVLDAMNALSDRDRLVLGYRYFLDLGEADMAAALGVARGTIKSRLSRAQQRLKTEIERRGGRDG